jgi:hypothetical protein
MVCIEILHNGKRLCVMGHEKSDSMQISLLYVKDGDVLGLSTWAYVRQTPELQETLSWLKERPVIRVGDTIEMKVTRDLAPDAGHLSSSFGRRVAEGQQELFCSFCGKSQHDVKKMVAGPRVFICNECVQLCTDVIGKEDPQT